MGLMIDGLGVFFAGEHVLAQVEDRDVLMMRMFGAEVQDLFVVASFGHQDVQDQNAPFVPEPLGQIVGRQLAFVHLDPVLVAQGLQQWLPGPVTIMQALGHRVKITGGVFEEFRHKDGLAAA